MSAGLHLPVARRLGALHDMKNIEKSCDLVVCGGGVGGVITAVTAARKGLRVDRWGRPENRSWSRRRPHVLDLPSGYGVGPATLRPFRVKA
jgi:hypothetical protein